MRKILTLVLILLVTINTQDYRDALQQQLNGLFEANSLPHPTTIDKCYDDDTAKSMFDFQTDFWAKGAKGSAVDIANLAAASLAFIAKLPDSTKKCLVSN